MRKKIVAVIGPSQSKCSKDTYEFAEQLGHTLASRGLSIVCGGKGGVMEAVCKGAKLSDQTFNGATIGILPEDNDEQVNEYVDIVVPTGIGIARNIVIINMADVVIALAGGSGTLSELAFAWQKNKPVFAFSQYPGWAAKLAGEQIDNAREDKIIRLDSMQQLSTHLDKIGL